MIDIKYTIFADTGEMLKISTEDVAIVGSSGKLRKGFSTEIDSHDYVIRFNRAPIIGYEDMVGTKENLRVVNNHVFNNNKLDETQWPSQPKNFIRDLRNKSLLYIAADLAPWYNRERNAHKSCRLYMVQYGELNTVKKTLNISTSSPLSVGLGAICLCVVSGIKPTLYGFDLEQKSPRDHYWESRPPAGAYHNVGREKEILLELVNKKMVILK